MPDDRRAPARPSSIRQIAPRQGGPVRQPGPGAPSHRPVHGTPPRQPDQGAPVRQAEHGAARPPHAHDGFPQTPGRAASADHARQARPSSFTAAIMTAPAAPRAPQGDEPPRRRRRAHPLLMTLLALFIAVVAIGVPVAVMAPVPKAVADVRPLTFDAAAEAEPDLPGWGDAAIGFADRPGLLARSGSKKPQQIASITKVVTALVVLEKHPLEGDEKGPKITFDYDDVVIAQEVAVAGGSGEPVESGWTMSQRDVMKTMLIPSANNYARSLAAWAFGSEAEFAEAAAEWLDEKGLDDTTIVEASGLDDRNTSTTADLVELGRLALREPVLEEIVNMRSATVKHVGEITTSNEVLGKGGVEGVKTGTDETGAHLLFAARGEVGGTKVRLVGVVLGAADETQLNAQILPLIRSTKKGMHEVVLAKKGQTFATYETAWGETVDAVAAETKTVLVWSDGAVAGTASVEPIRGGEAGQEVGSASFTVGDEQLSVPLELETSVLAAPFYWRLTHPIR